jgi:L-glutamine-phosphate cytidylyltransferase
MSHTRIKPVTIAVLLAAGMGSRLGSLTCDAPKCLTEINGQPFIERLVHALRRNGIKRLIVVVGYLDECVRDYLDGMRDEMQIEFVANPKFRTTNNIYSLWLVREIVQEPFMLVECDLVFEPELLGAMTRPDRIAVSERLPWMNGSLVTIDSLHQVTALHVGGDLSAWRTAFKTVNIYSFSLSTWGRVSERLERHVEAGRKGGYYETVIAELIAEGGISLEAVFFDEQRWYEVDTLEDLREAELLFPVAQDNSLPVFA